ncbi:hypothetical protein H9Y04_35525 [Streptomyces sp. TRM66268-LWL]|uniref:PE domain-containing protein n=1 Tax=Streptomyces polyasparticus TaxID=2767826 RepID=A0ABR7SQS9_9ACTN|nr:DUF6507 family protein [Streptomyces polyasparticus]MBC9717856.1 hypothetical protein [Streptomyces polyasparticus]
MTGWDITPSGVDSVISLVRDSADKMNKGIAEYGVGLNGAAQDAGTLAESSDATGGLVALALAQFAEHYEVDTVSMMLSAAASANGAIDATNAYINGDLEQAWNAQRQAVLGPDVTGFLAGLRSKGGK